MLGERKESGSFVYVDEGKGHPLVLLHGLMGGLSNFNAVLSYFVENGYRVILPEMPMYSMPLLKTNIKSLSNFLEDFLSHMQLDKVTLIGNSLGGHVSLVYTKNYGHRVHSLCLTGSSGLYESAMGDSFPRRGDYEYIRKKTEEVFFNKEVATKELVDEVFESVNDRNKVLRTISFSKSAIRHNMSADLAEFKLPVCLIWGKNDGVTPPHVAEKFHELLPDSELNWIDQCGHAAMMERPEEFNRILHDFLKRRVS
jgi:pimeloyl-ACP methyl ester carboxylesterase